MCSFFARDVREFSIFICAGSRPGSGPAWVFGDYREGGIKYKRIEAATIMMSLFDEEQIMKAFIKSERHDEARETAERLIKKGKMPLDEIAECVPALSFDELKELEAGVMQSV